MRALLLGRPAPIESSPLRLADRPPLEPAPDELIVSVAACAVCRTDLQIVEGDLPPRRLPIVPGHQAVGRVTTVGSAVVGWNVGDRVGVGWLASACGECAACQRGDENLCPDARFTGWDQHGGYAGQLAVRADFAVRLPAGFDDLAAAPLLCGGVIGYRSLRLSGIRSGERLGLYGFGASASITIQVARHIGCEVYVVTRSMDEQERARRLGAAWAGGYGESPPVALDGAITFAPVGSAAISALATIRPGATVAINAIHLDRIPEFDYDLLWRERGLRSVANYTRADARQFLDLAARIPIRTEIDVAPLERANESLQRLKSGALRGTAVLQMAP
jgi:alcohol dehydrogenase, propanol-preferring